MADDHVRPRLRQGERATDGREVGPPPHPGAGRRDSERAQLVEVLTLVLERDQRGSEASLDQTGDEDRPLPLRATGAQVRADEERARHQRLRLSETDCGRAAASSR